MRLVEGAGTSGRVTGARDVESWELERAAKAGQKSVRIGIDATMDLEDVDKLIRPITPGADTIRLSDYVDNERKPSAA